MSGPSPALVLAALAGEVTALAFCWKLTRADGVVLGFTSHDRPLRVDGLMFASSPGMTPSAVSGSLGFEPDSMAISGALSVAAVRALDLDVGRWDQARVDLYCCDWSEPLLGLALLMRGYVGDVSRRQAAASAEFGDYSVEIVSEMVKFLRGGPPRSSPSCRAELGDNRCGVDMAGRSTLVMLADGGARTLMLAEDLPQPADFAEGRLRFVTGPLSGIERRIESVDGRAIALTRAVSLAVSAGVKVRLTQGCNKTFATCAQRFANGAMFDGEPHLPGSDALIRYGEF